MRNLLLTACIAVVTAPAGGQIRFFFDRAGVGEQEDRGSVDPLDYDNPVVVRSGRLYLYAEYLGANDLWLGMGLNIDIDGDATFTDASIYNHMFPRGYRRWTSRDQLITSDRKRVRFRAGWIGDPSQQPGGLYNWDCAFSPDNCADRVDPLHYRRGWDSQGGGLGTTLVGWVDIAGSQAEVYVTVETFGLVRLGGGSDDFVYFGYFDEPVPVGDVGRRTRLPEALVTSCDACDTNCDGAADARDIEPFLGLLFAGDSPCSSCAGDTNRDGRIDAQDIEGFIDCLFR